MRNKFTIELVWHNCKTYPPKEAENTFLLVTNGYDVYGMAWYKTEGYWVAIDDVPVRLASEGLENWWWADIEQTVREERKFEEDCGV